MEALKLPAAAVLLQIRVFRKAELARPIDDFQSNSSSLHCETKRGRDNDRQRKGESEREIECIRVCSGKSQAKTHNRIPNLEGLETNE